MLSINFFAHVSLDKPKMAGLIPDKDSLICLIENLNKNGVERSRLLSGTSSDICCRCISKPLKQKAVYKVYIRLLVFNLPKDKIIDVTRFFFFSSQSNVRHRAILGMTTPEPGLTSMTRFFGPSVPAWSSFARFPDTSLIR